MGQRKVERWFFPGVQRTVMANYAPGTLHIHFFYSYSNHVSGYCHCTHFTGEEIDFDSGIHVFNH